MLKSVRKSYDHWRRRTFPPSVADVQWRFDFFVKRLNHLENLVSQLDRTISSRFPYTCATPALQREIIEVLRLLEPKSVVGFEKIRVGNAGDGGYVQIDDLAGVSHALSFGICDDDSWDLAMAEANVPVEQFDHSVDHAPSTHPLLRFHRKMIAAHAGAETATLPDLVAEFSASGDADMILKIDIEGCEWDVFDQANDAVLGKFTQILCEFHDLSQLNHPDFRARAARVFRKLTAQFAPVHIHGNNAACLSNLANVPVPDVLEVTFVNRRRYRLADCAEIFPTALDAPNAPHLPDIFIGPFKF